MSEAVEGQGRMQAQNHEQDQEQEQMADQAGSQQDRVPGQSSDADALTAFLRTSADENLPVPTKRRDLNFLPPIDSSPCIVSLPIPC